VSKTFLGGQRKTGGKLKEIFKEMDENVKNLEFEEEAVIPDPQNSLFPPWRLIQIGAWFGLLTGLLEGFYLFGWRNYFKGYRIFLSHHVLWMAPITEMVLFILMGGLLALLFWQIPRLISIRICIFFFALFSFLGVLLIFPQLDTHRYRLAKGHEVNARNHQ
jgi:hypothetical protein